MSQEHCYNGNLVLTFTHLPSHTSPHFIPNPAAPPPRLSSTDEKGGKEAKDTALPTSVRQPTPSSSAAAEALPTAVQTSSTNGAVVVSEGTRGGGGRLWGGLTRRPGMLLWCSLMGMLRNPSLLVMHYVGAAAMGLLVGFVFFNIQVESTSGEYGL